MKEFEALFRVRQTKMRKGEERVEASGHEKGRRA
jgi:hypothetical protein